MASGKRPGQHKTVTYIHIVLINSVSTNYCRNATVDIREKCLEQNQSIDNHGEDKM